MYIKKDSIEKCIEIARIDEIIGQFVTLKKQGVNFYVEGNKSLIVSPAKEMYKDFATNEGGNVMTYLMKQQQMSFKDAIQYIAKHYNIELEFEKGEKNVETDLHHQNLIATITTAKDYFFNTLKGSQEAIQYLANRGISFESIEKFGIGYASPQWTGLLDYATKYHSLEHLKGTFLIKENEEKKTHYDRYRNRITFALHTRTGETIGFTGRVLGEATKEVAKYINPSDTELYKKSTFIYGLHQAQSVVKRTGECIIVEGQTDVILMHQLEACNTIALSGLSISAYQLKVLQSMCKKITLFLDGDKAGEKGASRILELLLHAGFDMRIIEPPTGEDPASFCLSLIKEDTENAQQALASYLAKNKQTFLQYATGKYESQYIDKEAEAQIPVLKSKFVELEKIKNQLYEQIELLKLDMPILRDEEYKEAKEAYQSKTKAYQQTIREERETVETLDIAQKNAGKIVEDITKRVEFMNQLAKLICSMPSETMREAFKKEACKKFEELKKYKWAEEIEKLHPKEEEDEDDEKDTANPIYQIRRYIQRNLHLRISIIDNEVQGKLKNEKFNTNIDSLKELNLKKYIPVDDTALKVDLQEKGYILPEKTLTDFLKVGIPRFNVFEDYFSSLKCDGDIDYFNYFYKSFDMVEKDRERFAGLFPNWFARVVATAIDDKFYNKQCLMFMGGQNIGKSSLCTWFAPPALSRYITSTVDITSKDGTIALCENLFINLEEFDRQPHNMVAAMKAYMAMQWAKVRPPFEKKAVQMSRRVSFVGNTNEATFLKDTQGGSVRWLCFPLQGTMKWEHFNKVDIDRMYGLAYLAYKKALEAKSWKSIEMTAKQISDNNDENRKFAEFTEEMFYLCEVFRPVPPEAISDDMVLSEAVFFKNSTAVIEEIRKYYYITEHREIKNLSSKKMGEALQFFGYQQGKFKRYTHRDLYVYAMAWADKTQSQPQGFYEGE